MWEIINQLVKYIEEHDGINDKTKLENLVKARFNLEEKRSIFTSNYFSIRFSKANSLNFGNTVLSLSELLKYDNIPFIVCIVSSYRNYLLLGNTTFLKKISHSSKNLTMENIKGSFNGSDILKIYGSLENTPENFAELFSIHQKIGFYHNLERLVEETSNIMPTGKKYDIQDVELNNILDSPQRAFSFIQSEEYLMLKNELDSKVKLNSQSIFNASLIPNVNIRGRLIEYLIAGDNELLIEKIRYSLATGQTALPEFKTEDDLGDYKKMFKNYYIETDIKTKLMFLNSNPKAYNIDKLLKFLSINKTIFMFYFIDIEFNEAINTYLVSMFDERIIKNTRIQHHWAGRNTRGVTQLEGKVINDIIKYSGNIIDLNNSKKFIEFLVRGYVV